MRAEDVPGERGPRRLLAGAALLTAGAAALVLAFVVLSLLPLLLSGEIVGVLGGRWRPRGLPPEHGIAPMIAGSLALALLATAVALPPAVGLCVFAGGAGPAPLRRPILAAVHAMTAVPTVVLGFVSVILLVPLLRDLPGGGPGFSLLAAALTLALLVLPTVTLVLRSRLEAAGPALPLACAALGMDAVQAHARVLLPAARRGLVAAAVLGFCRAAGDTMVALMVSGNAARFPDGLLRPVRTLTAHVALVLATDTEGPEVRSVAAAGAMVFLLTAGVALLLRRLLRDPPAEASRADFR